MIPRSFLTLVVALGLSNCVPHQIEPAESSPAAAATVGDPKAPTQKARSIGVAKARQDCVYYTTTPKGKMALAGSLSAGTRVDVLKRTSDGWSEVRLSNRQVVSIPTEDLATLSQYKRVRSRARAAERSPFNDPRPKISPGSVRGLGSKLPTAPPPPDFVPPPLPDSSPLDPLSDLPSVLLEKEN